MAKPTFDPSDDRFIRGIIRRKVRQLIGRAGYQSQDFGDLENDIYVRVLRSLKSFNPNRAHLYPFVTTVVERYVANILRNKQAEKRDYRRITSLNLTIEITGEGLTELAQAIGDRELDARLGRQRRSECELVQLALDLADVMASLPDDWRTLLELRKTQTMADIARELGVPRTTLNDWMRRIRKRFEKAGMQDYLS